MKDRQVKERKQEKETYENISKVLFHQQRAYFAFSLTERYV